ncbi:unnamed protein product, partial [Choristocarpus tenellus]
HRTVVRLHELFRQQPGPIQVATNPRDLLKEIDLGFSTETGMGDMHMRSQLSRKKRQLAEGNICIVQTQPSEYNGIEFLPFTIHHKDTIQWNARHHYSYGGMFSAGGEVVFVTEDFE